MTEHKPLEVERAYTVEECADFFRTCTKTVRTWIRNGELTAYRIGRRYLIKPADRDAFMRKRRTLK